MTGWLVLGGRGRLGGALMAIAPDGSQAPTSQALDLCDSRALAKALDTLQPSRVVNCAALTDVDACEVDPSRAEEVNGAAVGRLATLCAQRQIQLCQISTDYVLQGNDMLMESQPYNPVNAYGASKALGEQLSLEASADHLVVRVQWLFGGGKGDFVRFVRDRALKGDVIPVIQDQRSIPSYTPDLADWLVRLFQVKATGIVHLANRGSTSRWDQALEICRSLHVTPQLRPVTWADLGRPAPRPRRSVLDTAHAVALTGHLYEVEAESKAAVVPPPQTRHPRPWQSAQEDWLEQLKC